MPVGAATATVEVRVRQDVNDALSIYISARPEGGNWRTLGSIPLPLGDGFSSSGRYRYGHIVVAVTLVPIHIPDAGLRAAVEEQLGKAPGALIFVHEMATLRELDAHNREIRSLEGLQYATRLTRLDAGRDTRGNAISDLSPLEGLGNLTHLLLGWNNISDLSPLVNLENLWYLYVPGNSVSNISPLSGLAKLGHLIIFDNNISNILSLSNLPALKRLEADGNNISNLGPLVANAGLGSGDKIGVERNPIDQTSINLHVPVLRARGVDVIYDEVIFTTADGPQIYNDNVFVLPVSENVVLTADLQIQDYVVRFYQYFEDGFDFLMILSNLKSSEDSESLYYGRYLSVRNNAEGIGQNTYSDEGWSRTGKLHGVMHFPYVQALKHGPMLHELMHRWANYAVPSAVFAHWGFSSANGQLGGFDINDLVDHGGGRYSAGRFGTFANGGNSVPYSPIELYMAGFIPPEDVPDLWVAEDGEWLFDEDDNGVDADDGDLIFTATRVKIYTVEDIIVEHGLRIPDHSEAQHGFRAAVILLIDEHHPATKSILESVSSHVSWFSHPSASETDGLYNFYEATGGRGTITMNGLSQFLKSQIP